MTADASTSKAISIEGDVELATLELSPSPPLQGVDDTTHRDHALFFNGLLPIMDLASFVYATYLTKYIYGGWFAATLHTHPADDRIMLIVAALAPLLLYDKRFISVASRQQTGALVRCFLTGFFLLAGGVLAISAFGGILTSLSLTEIILWLVIGMGLTATTRVVLAGAVLYCARKGLLTEVVAIVGSGIRADRLVHVLRNARPITPELLGVFDDEPSTQRISEAGIDVGTTPTLGNIEDLIVLGKSRRIDWIFLTLRHADEDKLASIVHRLKALSVPVALSPPTLDILSSGKRVDYIADAMPVTLLQSPAQGWRTKLRSIGQFLPRWIVTLVMMIGLLGYAAWSRLMVLRMTNRKESTNQLVCELDNYTVSEFVGLSRQHGHHRGGYVVTPNADHFLRMHEDLRFRDVYENAAYVLLDSRFLANIMLVTRGLRLPVCTGSDLTAAVFANLQPSDRIVIIGGRQDQVATLTHRYGLKSVAHHNPPMGFIHDEKAIADCLQFIETHSPYMYCILAVGTPQQEYLAKLLADRNIARGLTLCTGAAINFMTGVEKRAPTLMRRAGLEWLFRLARNPMRLARRYLINGPRVFRLLRKTKIVLRAREREETVTRAKAA